MDSQSESAYVSANGGKLTQPFTIGTGHYVWIDGANAGPLDFYLIPSAEVDNFRNCNFFRAARHLEATTIGAGRRR